MKQTLTHVVKLLLATVLTAGASASLLQAQLPQDVGTWLSRGAVADPRVGAAAVTLDDGRTVIAGGTLEDGSVTGSVTVYDPVANTTMAAGQLLAPRVYASATLLADGRVLIAGGLVGGAPSADVEIFDLATGVSVVAATMTDARAWHASARLFDGAVLIVGGTTSDGTALSSAEIFDPAANNVYPAGLMTTPRMGASATTMIDHRVLIAGGNDGTKELATAEIYDAYTSAFTIVPTQMAVARSGHTALLLPHNGGVLLAGGSAAGTILTTTDLFVPAIFPDPYSWGMGSFAPTGSLTASRAFAIGGALGDNGFAYVAGGGSADAEAYRFATIKTDKDDYPPGEPATITGSGWQPGEAVTLTFQEDPAVHDDYSFAVTADALGNIYWDQWAPEEHDLNVRFYLTAQGAASRSQMTFTDSRTITAATLNGGSVVTVAPGASINAAVFVTTNNSNGNQNWRSTSWQIATASGTMTCVDHPNHDSSGSYSESFSVTAPTTPGTYNAYFMAFNNDGCSTQESNLFTLSASVIVGGTLPTVTSIVRAAADPTNAGTASWTVTFNKNVTGVDAGDFALAQTGLTGSPAISGVAGGPAVYTVSASTGNGTGTLGLNLVDNNSIIDATSNPLGGAGDGGLVGELYSIDRTLTPTITAAGKTYDGNNTATILTRGFTSALPVSADVVVTGGTATFADANAGNGKTVTATGLGLSGADAARFVLSSTTATTTADISKLTAVVSVSGFSGVYDGVAHGATGSATGLGGADLSASLNLGATFTNVPGGTAHWTFTGGANYNDQNGDVAISITPATATILVNGYTGAYDAAAHGASLGSAVGVGGANLAAAVTIGPETFTNVPGGIVNWSFAEPNYISQSGTANIVISRAVATVNVTGYSGTYDAAAHGATGTATGVGGVDLSASLDVGAAFTNAPGGTASWTFSGGANYTDQNGAAAIVIDKATANVTVNGYTATYDAAAHGATGTAIGVGGVDLSANLNFGATFTNAPGGTASWSFTGGTNYTDQNGTAAIVINKADALVSVSGYTGTYDATAHGATGTVTGVGGANLSASLNLGDTFINAPGGTASWTFTGGTNYTDQNGTAAIVINKADALVSVSGYTGTYDAAPHGATGTATGVGGANLSASLNFGDTFVNAPGGTASWTFTGGTNYTDQNGTAAIVINKATATVTVNGYAGTYDAAAHGATGTATGVAGADLSSGLSLGGSFTNVPGGTAHWTFAGGANYHDQNGDVAIAISPATATIVVTGFTGTYDAAAHGATLASAIGVGGANLAAAVTIGSETFTNAPGGAVNWSFAEPNYVGQNGTAAIVINKATANITVNGFTGSYDATAHGATGAATGIGGVDLGAGLNLGASFTDVPGGSAHWTFGGGANYHDQNGDVAIAISPATATIVVNGYTGTYDGTAHGASLGSAVGVGGANLGAAVVIGTETFTSVPGGSVNWSFAEPNYVGQSGTVNVTISQAVATISVTGYTGTYNGAAHGATGTATGVGGIDLGVNLQLGATFTNAPGGTASWTFAGGTNYTDQNGTVAIVIDKAAANVAVNGYTGTYDATAHGATGTATGIGGVDLGAGLNLGASFTDVPGGSAHWSFVGGTNYVDQSGTVAIQITARPLTVSAVGSNKVYDGSIAATVTLSDNRLGTDAITVGHGSATFNDKKVGLSKPIQVTGIAIGGAKAGNYSANTTATTAGDITPLVITVAGITANNKPFDGNTVATLNLGTASLVSAIGGDSVMLNLAGAVGTFSSPAVGEWPVAISGLALAGSDKDNYSLTQPSTKATIGEWSVLGFHTPVGIVNSYKGAAPVTPPIWNTIKGGQAVPLKFNLFATTGGTELTNVNDVLGFSLESLPCSAGGEDPVDPYFVTTGATTLRYSGGQFIQNWDTPKGANKCYRITMTARDRSTLSAFFKTK